MRLLDQLNGSVQRGLITEVLRLASRDNKQSFLCAFSLAERLTPENQSDEVRCVREKVKSNHPALCLAAA